MKTFKERLELLDLALLRETPESLAAKLQAYGDYTEYTEEDVLEEVPEICWQVAHWNNNEKYQRRIVCAANRFKMDYTFAVIKFYDNFKCFHLNHPLIRCHKVFC